MTFDELFDKSVLPTVMGRAKTLSKEECRHIYAYMGKFKPHTILEFGLQYGCSTRAFLEMAKWIDYPIKMHSWDIADNIQKDCVDRGSFIVHFEDVTGKEEKVIEQYKPDLIFLDAHPYVLTKSFVQQCMKHKTNFMMHDVALEIYERLKRRSHGFRKKHAYDAWELYVLMELISPKLLKENYYENDLLRVNLIRDKYGLAIVEFK